MESGPRTAVTAPDPSGHMSGTTAYRRGPVRGPAPTGVVPTGGLTMVVAGTDAAVRAAVLNTLLDITTPALRAPDSAFLVLRYGAATAGAAYLPGHRQPHVYRAELPGFGSALDRPPRRVELTVPAPLLRHVNLVAAPDHGLTGEADPMVLLDIVARADALLFVCPVGTCPQAPDRRLLTAAVDAGIAVFIALVPVPGGLRGAVTRRGPEPVDDASGTEGAAPDPWGSASSDRALTESQVVIRAEVPHLAGARWHLVDPAQGEAGSLRRDLATWVGLRRIAPVASPIAVGVPAVSGGPAVSGSLPVGRTDWLDELSRQVRASVHRIRQDLAIELANIHLRGVQEIVFGGGCAGLPAMLDRELHALSLRAVRACADAMDTILTGSIDMVLGRSVPEQSRQRIALAVRGGVRNLEWALLVTRAGEADVSVGYGVADAFAAYPDAVAGGLLPPVGIALAGDCYQLWDATTNVRPGVARSWLQRVLRGVEVELLGAVSRRFEAARTSLAMALTEAVSDGPVAS